MTAHFCFEFLSQIWTWDTLRHIPEPIMTIFDICLFLTTFFFEYFQKMDTFKKSKDISITVHLVPIFSFGIRLWPDGQMMEAIKLINWDYAWRIHRLNWLAI